ncbi:MAG: UvrD-helicase domain-containing protein, partial [Verrucomicrobiota bacterium]
MSFDPVNTTLVRGITRLEASAGTGKTFTLAGVFLRLVLEFNVPATEILVVTYTKAATAELRGRIRCRLR